MADFIAGGAESFSNGTGSASHSRQSSMSSGRSSCQNKEDADTPTNALPSPLTGAGSRRDSDVESDLSAGQLVVLRDGGTLKGESRTESVADSVVLGGMTVTKPAGEGEEARRGSGGSGSGSNLLEIPARQPTGSGVGTARRKVSKSGTTGAAMIPEVQITIPNDGCLASFSTDAMANFFQHLHLDDRLVSHLHRNGLDGRKFGRLKDSDLDNLRLNNPVIVYFRDRTAPAVSVKKNKQRLPFVL